MERRRLFQLMGSVALAPALSGLFWRRAEACTRVLWNSPGQSVIVGRTMDWPESTQPKLYALPAGMARDGGKLGGVSVVGDNPLQWTSKHGSLVAAAYDLGAIDGMNETGLAGHLLYLNSTDYGARDAARPGLQAGLWLQYALDCAASVKEALALLAPVQIVMVEAHGHKASLHLALEDASGDSAIIEYIGGRAVIHHGRQYSVVTNDPSYDQQLVLLRKMDEEHAFAPASRDMPLPGNMNPVDRFQRAAFFSRFLPQPHNTRQAVAAMFSIMANVSVPFGAPYKDFGTYNTEYRSVADLTDLVYYFQLTTVPSVSWTALARMDLKPGAPALVLDPDALDLAGEVSGRYRPVSVPF
ncbi:linear amide C-N hydrolase [Acidocella sp.]|uniref:linear amide C-N hydrolase n=1 Tax=Acidocella sp. TaxID=50710 RepID=UPI003D026C42